MYFKDWPFENIIKRRSTLPDGSKDRKALVSIVPGHGIAEENTSTSDPK